MDEGDLGESKKIRKEACDLDEGKHLFSNRVIIILERFIARDC